MAAARGAPPPAAEDAWGGPGGPGQRLRAAGLGLLAAVLLASCGDHAGAPSGPTAPGDGGGQAPLETVTFADSSLTVAVAAALGVTGPDLPAREVAALAQLDGRGRGIGSLAGIEQMAGLEALVLAHNAVTDLAPLRPLRRLTILVLTANRVRDLSPLAALPQLEVLAVDSNLVADPSPLLGLISLREVDLTANPLAAAAQEQVDALRGRGVKVTLDAPVGAENATGQVVPVPLGDLKLLFASNRRTGSGYVTGLEVHALDVATGEVTNLSAALDTLPLADGSDPSGKGPFARHGVEPAQSPDGRRIAFTSIRDGNAEVYVMDADGSGARNLTRHPAHDSAPAWSPDGTRILFVSDRNGDREQCRGCGYYNVDIYVMDADGSSVQQLTFDPGMGAGTPAWSPDGRAIAFASAADGFPGIFAMDADGGNARRVSHDERPAWSPAWSPDGTRIAYIQSDDEDGTHVGVMAADGGGARQLTHVTAWHETPTWSPDGTRIAFGRLGDVPMRYDIFAVWVETGVEEQLTFDPTDEMSPSWAPF